ncbi:MAG: glycosyltransferase family 9 protein [Alphaproteobacteria bacterium]|nr:glycosyltransferase family 9 protein [Alphaproteobacteria bacterium]MCB9975370.1 glycosyltransferase family 9 protein [Rhodospirillales bacterium]
MNADNHRKKILVIKLGALGDFIQALGPMAAIRRAHPDAHMTILTTRPFEELAHRCGYFDEIWLDDKPRALDLTGWLSLRKKLLSGNFTRVYDLQNSDRTFFYFRLFPVAKRPEWVGAVKGASHSNRSPDRSLGHALEGHKQTLALAGIKDVEIDDLKWVKEDLSGFDLPPSYVLFVPGCAPQHPQKRWPAEHFAAIGNLLVQRNIRPVLLGTGVEKDINANIRNICPESLDLTGKTTLFQVVALARSASGALGNDTGPIHLIAATGCPCVALFSGTSDKIKHAPRGKNVTIIQEGELRNLNVKTAYNALMKTLAQREAASDDMKRTEKTG